MSTDRAASPPLPDDEEIRATEAKSDAQSMYKLALRLLNSTGKNYKTALRLLEKGAEKGDPFSQFQLGLLLTYHIFYNQKAKGSHLLHQSAEQLQKLAEQNNIDALFMFGTLCHLGEGVPENLDRAFKCYLKAAEAGHTNAQRELLSLYYNGTGTKQDAKAAVEWMQKAAEQGNRACQFMLACKYRDAEDGFPKDIDKAITWFTKSISQGYIDDFGYSGKNPHIQLLMIWITQAAEKKPSLETLESSKCQELLNFLEGEYTWYARIFCSGNSEEVIDRAVENKIEQFKKHIDVIRNAIRGNTLSLIKLAKYFFTGRKFLKDSDFIQKDKQFACLLYSIAAAKENIEAHYQLAKMYLRDPEVKNLTKAEEWLIKVENLTKDLDQEIKSKILRLRKTLLQQKSEQRDYQAAYQLGKIYRREARSAKAIGFFRTAAETKDEKVQAKALFRIGRMLLESVNCSEQDKTDAYEAFRQSAVKGNIQAKIYIGLLLEHGIGIVANIAEAKAIYKTAQRKDSEDATAALKRLEFINNLEQKTTDSDAQIYLANSFDNGVPDIKTLVRNARDQNNFTQNKLSLLCIRNPYKATYWYQKAAEQKNIDAQLILASRLSQGIGCGKNETAATNWYREAAELGSQAAQEELGRRLLDGKGCDKNIDAGNTWLERAKEKRGPVIR